MYRLQFAYTSNDFFVFVTIEKTIEFSRSVYASDKQMIITNPDFNMFKYICSMENNNIDDFLFSLYHGILTQVTGSSVFQSNKTKLQTLLPALIKDVPVYQRDEKILEVTRRMWNNYKDNRSDACMLEIMYDKLFDIAKSVDTSVFNDTVNI